MSFWSTSTGEVATKDVKAEGTYQAAANNDPLPDKSTVLAFIEAAEWKRGREEDGSPEFLQIQWRVEEPESVARRVVFQKLWVSSVNPNAKDPAKKRDKDLAMLAKIDAIAGGKLAKVDGKPDNDALAISLQTKQAVLKLGVWEMKDSGATGNWVMAISAKGGMDLSVPEVEQTGGGSTDLDDDIPF